jgi:hypothetical protein
MRRLTDHLALPEPAEGGARPLPFLERVGGAVFDEGPAEAGKVELDMRGGLA